MKQRLQIHTKADSSATKSEQTQFPSRPLTEKTQQHTTKPLSPTEIENQEFQQHQIEATKLEIQAKHGTITPEGETRLTLLQAKMNDVLLKRVEKGSNFGHNLGNITLNHPDRISLSTSNPLVQPKLTISQAGDQYEKEADQVASAVVSQTNTATSQNTSSASTSAQGTAEQLAPENNLTNQKQKFLADYSLAKELIKGINETAPTDKILEQLLNNFKHISFKYTMQSKSQETLLKGTLEGDCQTLALTFQKVAEEYFGIQDLKIESIKKPFLSEAKETPYQGRKPNCDGGKRWFFQNHYWVSWNGKVYDVLFLSQKKPEADIARQEQPLKSMLMPEEEYYETEKGKIVYPFRNEYLTVELGIFEKLRNFVQNLGRWLARDMDSIINRIRSLLTRGGNNTSDFESLIREVENNRTSAVTPNNPNQ